jgi:restriction system protein
MQISDWIVVPLSSQAAFAVGRLLSGYEYRTDLGEHLKHTRKVKWLNTALARSTVEKDLRFSLRVPMTVCRITRNDAEARLAEYLSTER